MSNAADPRWILARKRDGHDIAPDDLRAFLQGYVRGDVAEYQMSAFLMAAFLRGMSDAEAETMVRAMIESGDVLAWDGIDGPFVDKHSTGGVGDKVSIVLAPVLACLGVKVPMISGRGLGHTGGTLDKLEAVPGYRAELSAGEMESLLSTCGFFIAGQTPSLVPADRKLYALRDVTATVESTPLIVSSILSKKAAAGVECLVLDVKYGEAAFMETLPRARALAEKLVSIADRLGMRAVAVLSRMDGVLGRTAGNAVEIEECYGILAGREDEGDIVLLTEWLGSVLLVLSGRAANAADGRKQIRGVLSSGVGLERFEAWMAAQRKGGAAVEIMKDLPRAARRTAVSAPSGGYVAGIDGRAVGTLLSRIGGGRLRMRDSVDPRVGVRVLARPGERVKRGDTVLEVVHDGPIPSDDLGALVAVSADPPGEKPLIGGIVTRQGFVADPEAASFDF